MNTIKKITAVILALCMLIGMPLAIDVQAADTPVLYAGQMDDNKSLLIYSPDVTVEYTDLTKLRAYLCIVEGGNWILNNVIVNGLASIEGALSIDTATGNLVYTMTGSLANSALKVDKSGFTGDVDTITEVNHLLALAKAKNGASKLMLRLIETENDSNAIMDTVKVNGTALLASMGNACNPNTGTRWGGTHDGLSCTVLVQDSTTPIAYAGGKWDDKTVSVYFPGNHVIFTDTTKLKGFLCIAGSDASGNWLANNQAMNGKPSVEGTLSVDTVTGQLVYTMTGSISLSALTDKGTDVSGFDGDIDTVSEMLHFVKLTDYENARLQLRIVETEADDDTVMNGMIANGSPYACPTAFANKCNPDALGDHWGTKKYDGMYANVVTPENNGMMLSGVIVDTAAKHITVGFSGQMQMTAVDYMECGIAVVDKNGAIISDKYTRLGSGSFINWNQNKRTALSDTQLNTIADYMTFAATNEDYSAVFTVTEAKLAYEKGEQGGNGYVDTLYNANTHAPLVANGQNGGLDMAYVAIKTTEDVAAMEQDMVTMTEVKLYSQDNDNDRLIVTFSEPVVGLDSYIKNYLAVMDANGVQVTIDNQPIRWQIGPFSKYTTTGNQWSAVVSDSTFYQPEGGYADLITYLSTLTHNGKKIAENGQMVNGYHLQVILPDAWGGLWNSTTTGQREQYDVRYPHVKLEFLGANAANDHIMTSAGKKLYAPIMLADDRSSYYDMAVCDVKDGGKYEMVPLTVTGAKQLTKNSYVVTFSEPVSIAVTGAPAMGLRMVDENNRLVWVYSENGITLRGAEGDGKSIPLQYLSTEWAYTDDTQMAVKITISRGFDISILFRSANWPAALDGCRMQVFFEETKPPVAWDGLVIDVVARDYPFKALAGNSDTAWDGYYFDMVDLLNTQEVTASAGKITGQNQITFSWNAPVSIYGKNAQGQSGSFYAGFRLVNENNAYWYYDAATDTFSLDKSKGELVQWASWMEFTDDTKTTMTARIQQNNLLDVKVLSDLLTPTGRLAEFFAANPGSRAVLCIEETNTTSNGMIESFSGLDGTGILADPFVPGQKDAVFVEIEGEVPDGDLKVTKVEMISDIGIKVSFSAPVEVLSNPWVALRLYSKDGKLMRWNAYTEEYTTETKMMDKDGNRIYKNHEGYTLEKEGYDAEGKWVNYTAQNNGDMQWWTTNWRWGDNTHTSIIYEISGNDFMPGLNLTDILAYDLNTISEGAYLGFCIEENTPDGVWSSNLIENIVRADDKRVSLTANLFTSQRDSYVAEMDDMILAYTPGKLTSSAQIISDTQIRIRFSRPVDMEYPPFMAIRLIDKDGKLMWHGKENASTPYQWQGTWEWEDDSHTSIIWTMNGGAIFGANNIYDLANYAGALERFRGVGTWTFVMEEVAHKDEDGSVIIAARRTDLVDNVSTLDGSIHLQGNYVYGIDGAMMNLNMNQLTGEKLELISAKAIDDQTIELTFNDGVLIGENLSLGVRYLTPSGDSEVLTDGKTAYFKGNCSYKDDTKKVVLWKLNSKHADNLSDILTFSGKFEWNKGARLAFVIMDDAEYMAPTYSMRINGISDLNGIRRLTANYATKEYMMNQLDIEVCYDLPIVQTDLVIETVYLENYTVYIVLAVVLAVLAPTVILIAVGRKKAKEGRR